MSTASDVNRAIEVSDKIVRGLEYAQQALEEFIYERLWEPLQYATFFEWWEDKLSHLSLAKELNIRAAYQFLEEGVNVDDIALAVPNLGPRTIENIKRERESGVSADAARGTRPPRPRITDEMIDKPIYVRPHGREKAAPASFIRIEVGPTMKAEFDRIAVELGRPTADVAKEGAERHFAELARKLSGEKKRAS